MTSRPRTRSTRPSPPCSAGRRPRPTRSRRSTGSSAGNRQRHDCHDERPAASAPATRRPATPIRLRPDRPPMKPARAITPWLFLAPALAVFGFAVLVPMVFTVGYSFTEWNGFGAMTFVGLDNYVAAATDPVFRDSFVHVVLYIAATLVLRSEEHTSE